MLRISSASPHTKTPCTKVLYKLSTRSTDTHLHASDGTLEHIAYGGQVPETVVRVRHDA